MNPEKMTYGEYVTRHRLDAARGCANGLIASLILWLGFGSDRIRGATGGAAMSSTTNNRSMMGRPMKLMGNFSNKQLFAMILDAREDALARRKTP